MTVKGRDRLVAGAGLLVLASSFLPWWTVQVRRMSEDGTTYETSFGSAWHMSSRWSAAVLITVGALVVSLVWRHDRGRVPPLMHLATVAAVALSIFLVLQQWQDVESLSEGSTSVSRVTINAHPLGAEPPSRDPAADIASGFMKRDDLLSFHSAGLNADVGWGMWVGLCAMALAGAALVAANHRSRPQPRAPYHA
ncbi:hypothetical protein AB0K04_07610 [Micromonospora coxensis]|uniref:hypothetical protein n=1 Tax=Micromonospora coxensis TaxID=356852 RepID=UPI00343E49E8